MKLLFYLYKVCPVNYIIFRGINGAWETIVFYVAISIDFSQLARACLFMLLLGGDPASKSLPISAW